MTWLRHRHRHSQMHTNTQTHPPTKSTRCIQMELQIESIGENYMNIKWNEMIAVIAKSAFFHFLHTHTEEKTLRYPKNVLVFVHVCLWSISVRIHTKKIFRKMKAGIVLLCFAGFSCEFRFKWSAHRFIATHSYLIETLEYPLKWNTQQK